MVSSPKLDRFKIAKQLTDKAVKVNALWAQWGWVLFKNGIHFGVCRASPWPVACPEAEVCSRSWPQPEACAGAPLHYTLPFELSDAFEMRKCRHVHGENLSCSHVASVCPSCDRSCGHTSQTRDRLLVTHKTLPPSAQAPE